MDRLGWRRRLPAVLLSLALAVAACQPAPSGPPASAPTSASPAPPASIDPGQTPVVGGSLADALRDAVSMDAILADLARLEAIAAANGGVRAAATPGYELSAEHVAAELRAAGYEVQLQPVDLQVFSQVAPSVVQVVGGQGFEDARDFKAMLMSASGDVTAAIHPLAFDPAAQPGDRGGTGCDPSDWDAVPAGVIVLVQPGPCFRRDVIVNAQSRGVPAIVTAYPEWTRDRVLRPTLLDPSGIEIPVIGATHELGVALFEASQQGREVRVAVDRSVEVRPSANVIAETPGGDASRVLVVGGHLDSVIDGPGINDNGSGTMAILEIARRLAALAPALKVRFAFWTGEEIGLLGSSAYVEGLGFEGLGSIEAYLNFDMLGSPNGIREVYDAADTSVPADAALIEQLFAQALEAQGLAWEAASVGGASDHAPFDGSGIPTGGLFSGANGIKTQAEAALFGGAEGAAHDPCYHLPCDTVANIDAVLLEQLARAAAWVIGRLASGEVALGA